MLRARPPLPTYRLANIGTISIARLELVEVGLGRGHLFAVDAFLLEEAGVSAVSELEDLKQSSPLDDAGLDLELAECLGVGGGHGDYVDGKLQVEGMLTTRVS